MSNDGWRPLSDHIEIRCVDHLWFWRDRHDKISIGPYDESTMLIEHAAEHERLRIVARMAAVLSAEHHDQQ